MRTLGDARRKAPVEQKKEETPVKVEETKPVETQTDGFDESIVIN